MTYCFLEIPLFKPQKVQKHFLSEIKIDGSSVFLLFVAADLEAYSKTEKDLWGQLRVLRHKCPEFLEISLSFRFEFCHL